MRSKLAIAVGIAYVLLGVSLAVVWIVENPSAFRWTLATAGTLFGAFVVYASLPRYVATEVTS